MQAAARREEERRKAQKRAREEFDKLDRRKAEIERDIAETAVKVVLAPFPVSQSSVLSLANLQPVTRNPFGLNTSPLPPETLSLTPRSSGSMPG